MKLVCIDGYWLNPDHIVQVQPHPVWLVGATIHLTPPYETIEVSGRDAASIAGSINQQQSTEQGP